MAKRPTKTKRAPKAKRSTASTLSKKLAAHERQLKASLIEPFERQVKADLAAKIAELRAHAKARMKEHRAYVTQRLKNERQRAKAAQQLLKQTTKSGKPKKGSAASKIREAYGQLRTKQYGRRSVLVSELAKRSRVPLATLHAYLLQEASAHRAQPTRGEPTAATASELKGALMLDGVSDTTGEHVLVPHLYIELYPQPGDSWGGA